MSKLFSLIIFTVMITHTSHARALTGEEVMTNMTDDQSYSYIYGAVEMAAFLARAEGQNERSECIMDWFFGEGDGVAEIDQALSYFNDRRAQAVMIALINRHCPAD